MLLSNCTLDSLILNNSYIGVKETVKNVKYLSLNSYLHVLDISDNINDKDYLSVLLMELKLQMIWVKK